MIYYIKGPIIARHPTYVIVEANGVGYQIFISLNTYSQLEGLKEAKVLTHFIVKEDGQHLYGFGTCLLYTSPSPRDRTRSRMPSSA